VTSAQVKRKKKHPPTCLTLILSGTRSISHNLCSMTPSRGAHDVVPSVLVTGGRPRRPAAHTASSQADERCLHSIASTNGTSRPELALPRPGRTCRQASPMCAETDSGALPAPTRYGQAMRARLRIGGNDWGFSLR